MDTAEEVKQVPKRLYKSTARSCNVITPQGETLHFKFGRFATRDEYEIAWLDGMIKRNEFAGQIYIDPNARTLSEEEENPMKALEKQIIAKYLSDQAKHLDPSNDMGESKQGPLKATSTSDIAPVALGGDGAARLMAAVQTVHGNK
jgi:trehalose/maltose hydrolase-like predicted phosphorylase